MPADEKLSDATGNHTYRNGTNIHSKETTREKLRSGEGQNYLIEKKTKENK